jgi:DNA-3-methyladenine glycosylase I
MGLGSYAWRGSCFPTLTATARLGWGTPAIEANRKKLGSGARGNRMTAIKEKSRRRCVWAESDPLLRAYHDEEWGVPEFDSRALWELLMLEGFQAGLAWLIVLRKREAFRKEFRGFNPTKVARFGEADIARMMANPDIIRGRAKIEATINGARIFVKMQNAGIDFSDWVWEMAGGKPIQNTGPVPVQSPLSVTISKELKRRGFKFVGPVIVYAWMQAAGIVNDHSKDCFRRSFCAAVKRT